MHERRGVLWLWLLATAIWIGGSLGYGATRFHWFEPAQISEVSDPNDEKYRVEIDPASTDDEILAFVQKSAGSKWLRKQCAKDVRGPWCDVVTSLRMPRQYFTWQYLAVSIAGLLSMLLLGSALFLKSSGFRRAANG